VDAGLVDSPPAAGTDTAFVAADVLAADAELSNAVLDTFPTCDAFATATAAKIDITDPNAPRNAPLTALIYMPLVNKVALKSMVPMHARQSYDQDVYAALNMGKHNVAFQDHGLPYALPIVTHWEDDDGRHTRYRASADDRWYVVAWGRGFTGVARGLVAYNGLISGVTNARGKGCNTRAKAEYLYLKAFYAGECGVVEVATLTPAV
jgi:hypothetical protein